MELYLNECKENLQSVYTEKNVVVVLGNEACDLDSAVSTLVYSYFLKKTIYKDEVVLPVLNVKREELKLHSEVAFMLEETSVDLNHVICKDEIDLQKFIDGNFLKVVLVDHNILSDEDSYLQNFVIEIVDHHRIEQPEKLYSCPSQTIEPVGSCSTLVARKIFSCHAKLMDPQIAMLLYGTILLDTVCLDELAKRVTDEDRNVISKLEEILEGFSRNEVFQALQKAKCDVSGFTPMQLLQKDLKVVSFETKHIALSSVPVLLEGLMSDPTVESTLEEFSSDNHYSAVILLGSHTDKDGKNMQRQIAIFSCDKVMLNNISDHLKTVENGHLQLEPIDKQLSLKILLYHQKNIALTRKYVLPIVRSFLSITDCSNPNECSPSKNCSLSDDPDPLFPDVPLNSYCLQPVEFPDSPSHHVGLINFTGEGELASDSATITSNHIDDKSRGQSMKKVITVNRSMFVHDSVNDDQKSLSSLSNKSDPDVFSPTEDIVLPEDEDIDTPEELENSDNFGLESSWSEPIPEMSAAEEYEEERSWKTCVVSGEERRIDMRVIDPYKKVLSHGGYHGETRNAIIIFSACYLPDRSRKDYDYVMDNLFLYVLSTLDQLVAEDYVLVYLHGATERGNMPSFGWLKRCYQMIDRRLRKNLKGLYLVHPTFWLKTIVIMTRPFISSKFSRKLKFVNSLDELSALIPMDHVCIPDKVKIFDEKLLDS